MIPKHFFVPQIIERRKPLSSNARRAGWIGCNIIIEKIPQDVKIFLVKDQTIIPQNDVVDQMKKLSGLASSNLDSRGWLLDFLYYVNKILSESFSTQDIYQYEKELQAKHPNNQNIKAKIRQQLQVQ